MPSEPNRISLFDSLNGEWLKLPFAVMQDCGPAAQTLGGLLNLSTRETYASVSAIAEKARLPVATTRKHLLALDARGWIANEGREHTRRGRPRRTATIKVTRQTQDHLEPYGVLPWWACCQIRRVGRLPWSARAVLSVVMARLCSLKAAAEHEGSCDDAEELEGSIANMGGPERWEFSLRTLTGQTGLDQKSVIAAKAFLNHNCGIVEWWRGIEGRVGGKHVLEPKWRFAVVVTPASEGRCHLGFDRGGKVVNG